MFDFDNITFIDMSEIDYSPEESHASAEAVYDGVALYEYYEQQDQQQRIQAAKDEILTNHDSLLLKISYSAEESNMTLGDYFDKIEKSL